MEENRIHVAEGADDQTIGPETLVPMISTMVDGPLEDELIMLVCNRKGAMLSLLRSPLSDADDPNKILLMRHQARKVPGFGAIMLLAYTEDTDWGRRQLQRVALATAECMAQAMVVSLKEGTMTNNFGSGETVAVGDESPVERPIRIDSDGDDVLTTLPTFVHASALQRITEVSERSKHLVDNVEAFADHNLDDIYVTALAELCTNFRFDKPMSKDEIKSYTVHLSVVVADLLERERAGMITFTLFLESLASAENEEERQEILADWFLTWKNLAANTPPPYNGPVFAMVAVTAWMMGKEDVVELALDYAKKFAPDEHPLVEVVDTVIDQFTAEQWMDIIRENETAEKVMLQILELIGSVLEERGFTFDVQEENHGDGD